MIIQKGKIQQDGFEKTQEEIMREKAEVLHQTGEKLSAALKQLTIIEERLNTKMESLNKAATDDAPPVIDTLFQEVNEEIVTFNKAREYAELRYYYLIVTREALGLRMHTTVEEFYEVPPKKKLLKKVHG